MIWGITSVRSGCPISNIWRNLVAPPPLYILEKFSICKFHNMRHLKYFLYVLEHSSILSTYSPIFYTPETLFVARWRYVP